MLQIEGQLEIEIVRSARSENRVTIVSSRPLQATRVFEGKTPEAVLAQIPLLFGVCRTAQSTAGARALQQALGIDRAAATDAAHAILVQLETAREHLFRILIDWPAALNEGPDAAGMRSFELLLPNFRKALFSDEEAFSLHAATRIDIHALEIELAKLEDSLAESVFGRPTSEWLNITRERELEDWISHTGTVAARFLRHIVDRGWSGVGSSASCFLPDVSGSALNDILQPVNAAEFIARPEWQDKACETSTFTRHHDCDLIQSLCRAYDNGLLSRFAARLVELAETPAFVRGLVMQLETHNRPGANEDLLPGVGIGQVEAARGRLVHRAVVENEVVSRYQIVAPTEWNFHPAGVVAKGLGRLRTSDEDVLRQQAAMLIQAVDPCVGYELVVH